MFILFIVIAIIFYFQGQKKVIRQQERLYKMIVLQIIHTCCTK